MNFAHPPLNPRPRRLVLLALAFALTAQLGAITDSDFEGAVSYDFRPPGARSLAMGGAFTALSDDATSVLVNPAGLSQLRKREFSFVAKAWSEDTHLDWGTGAYADLSNLPLIPPFPRPFREDRDTWGTRAGPAFVSYVHPFKRFTLSAFGAQLANTDSSFVRDQILVGEVYQQICPPISPSCQSSIIGGVSTLLTNGHGKLRLQRFGVAGSFALNNKLSVGATVFLGRLDLKASSTRFQQTNVITPQASILIVDETGRDRDFGYALGIHYHGKIWNWGVGYQRGEQFTVYVNPHPGLGPFPATGLPAPFNTPLRVPDRLTAGLSVRPTPVLTITAELESVLWRQVAKDVTSFHPNEIDPRFEMSDAHNPHLGAEYVVLADTSPLTLRAGIWIEQGHKLKYIGHSPDTVITNGLPPGLSFIIPGQTIDNGQHVLYPGGGSQQHFTAGIGYVVGRLQFDAGYDYAKWSRQFAISTIFRFR